jgi:hypothetical protein
VIVIMSKRKRSSAIIESDSSGSGSDSDLEAVNNAYYVNYDLDLVHFTLKLSHCDYLLTCYRILKH